MIASNIGVLYRKLGNIEEAGKWFESMLCSIEQNSAKTGVCSYGYDVAVEGYDNYLGTIHLFEKTSKMNEETTRKVLQLYRINGIQRLFYRIAWNTLETAASKPEEYISLRPKWKKSFRISTLMANFMYDSHLTAFLKERESKYLS